MEAIVYDTYGSPEVLQLREIDKPAVTEDDVLLRIRAASANPLDWHFMRGEPYLMRMMTGVRKPKYRGLGADVAGQIEAVGKNVTQPRVGDEVFGIIGGCAQGSFGEYACVPQDWLVPKPANLTFEQAAAVPLAGLTALQGLRDTGGVGPDQRVLINGAAGGVGTFAVQIAKSFGAVVTGVCSTRNVELVRSLGADEVIDYTRDDFVGDSQLYDHIFDAIGSRSLSDCRRMLTADGTYVFVGSFDDGRWLGPLKRGLTVLATSRFVRQNLVMLMAKRNRADLLALKELVEAGTITPIIDRRYELREVPEAIRYLEEGHARGKVVVTV